MVEDGKVNKRKACGKGCASFASTGCNSRTNHKKDKRQNQKTKLLLGLTDMSRLDLIIVSKCTNKSRKTKLKMAQ